jgi:hypothetical protein
LGQIYQGRVGKGVLFLVCIYTLFFYGLYLGTSSVQAGERTVTVSTSVYLPDTVEENNRGGSALSNLANNLYNRPQFLGQFWVGVAAWPAILQYLHYDRAATEALDTQIDDFYRQARNAREASSDKEQQQQADHYRRKAEELEHDPSRGLPILGQFQREPSQTILAIVHNAGDKRLELGWVYAVIAGVLNIMVIYDALAGPAFLLSSEPSKPEA